MLHNVHNAFKKALKELAFDIDQFAVETHSLKLSSAKREDYAIMEEVDNLLAK